MPDIKSNLLDFVEESDLAYGAPELCGVVLADGDIMQLPNIHEKPVEGFHIEPKAFLEQIEAGAIATWHTHPGRDPNLSHEDFEGFHAWPSLTHHIVGIRDGEPTVHSFRFEDGVLVTA